MITLATPSVSPASSPVATAAAANSSGSFRTSSNPNHRHGSFKQSTKLRRRRRVGVAGGDSSGTAIDLDSPSTKPLLSSPAETMSTSPLIVNTKTPQTQTQTRQPSVSPRAVSPESITPATDDTTTTTTSIALDFSANACACLQDQDLKGALVWYQRALLVYQDAAAHQAEPLGIVDTCNAAATLHNMGAVYNALQQGDAALQCYHDAEQLYRECRDRLQEDDAYTQTTTRLSLEALSDQETVCLTALIAETLHHRAQIYETSVWDSVAALECHEACVQLLQDANGVTLNEQNPTLRVICVDDVYFQQDCLLDTKLEWLTASYQALAKLYANSDTPQDGLVVLQQWKMVLQQQPHNKEHPKWRKSLADCWKQLSEFHFAQHEMELGVEALHTAMDLQMQQDDHNKNAADAILSQEILQQMHSIGIQQEKKGNYDQAIDCYENVLLLVSRYLGEDHLEVAETLVHIGRVMELQGNLAGGLDLYQAAHTIYQAAAKKDSTVNRTATESVVRIANVLMTQKRWLEAVQFLTELPQAKQWMESINNNTKNKDSSTALVVVAANNQNDPHPSMDQAIVFRELGRAYMGMGELAKAKQCLLESARRLEGTDHEEDLFELLMHVEFCQKQERMAALATARNRSRSRSRARSRSAHSRSNSIGSSSVEAAVAAVLTPRSVSPPMEVTAIGSAAAAATTSPHRTRPLSTQTKALSLPNSPVQQNKDMNNVKGNTEEEDAEIASPKSVKQLPQLPVQVASNTSNDDNDEAASITKSPRSPTLRPFLPALNSEQVERLQEHPLLPANSADSRSLGSLGTQSDSINKSKEKTNASASSNQRTAEDDQFDVNHNARDSFQIQRANDIVLKRVSGGYVEDDAKSVGEDGKSTAVSSVLLGLDIDIDLPPGSPMTLSGPSGSELVGLAMVPTQSTISLDKPFDETSLSQASSREQPFDEQCQEKPRNTLKSLSNTGSASSYALSVQEKMMYSVQEQEKDHLAQDFFGHTVSDLTSTGRSTPSSASTSSTHDAHAPPPMLPSLLQDFEETEPDTLKLMPPPPPPPPPKQLSRPPFEIRKPSSQTESSYPTQYPAQSLASPESPERIAMESLGFSPIKGNGTESHDDDDEDDDDASSSSDPFETFDEFDDEPSTSGSSGSEEDDGEYEDEDEGSNGDDEMSQDSASYGGDSESEQGYTRFDKTDLSSDEDDSVGRGQMQKTSDGVEYDDARQSPQAQGPTKDIGSPGTREPPVVILGTGLANLKSRSAETTEAQHESPTFDVQTKDDSTKKEKIPVVSSPQKQALDKTKQASSPGARIVQALSNTIRRRRKAKKVDEKSQTFATDTDVGGEAKQESSPTKSQSLPDKLASLSMEREESDTFPADGPIQFVSMATPSYDDNVSQITFQVDENYTKYSKTNQWWGQLTLPTEQLEGYLHQAVEAAEGFLSANAIHAKMKSQPLDFDSDDEDDDDLLVRDPASTVSVANMNPFMQETAACSPTMPAIPMFRSASEPHATKPVSEELKSNAQSPQKKPFEQPPATPTSATTPPEMKSASPPAKSLLVKEIEKQETLLKQLELEALNDDHVTPKVASTLFNLSILYLQNEKLDEALKSTNEALRHQKLLGDSSNAARSLHLLADIFVRKGEYDSALSCYAEVQEIELKLYGYVEEETANTLNRIGSVLARQSKFSLAMEKHQEALRILKEVHGEELRHPLVSQTLIHIGAVYYRERNSLATVRKGKDKYSTFIEVGMLEVIGRAHEDRGSYKMAISFFEEKLQCLNQKRKDTRSAEGRANLEDMATTLNSLGMLSCRAGVYMEAIDYYDRALEVQKKIGCDKLHIATARVLTATVQFHLGFFQHALRMLKDALKELKAETGSDHETVAATWFQIGVVQVALCEYDEGMDALEEALRIQTKLLGKAHPATLRTRREIGNMYAIYESEVDAAFVQYNDILTIQRRIHSPKHPNVAETLHSLGCAYARKGDYAAAIKTLEECYYMRIDFLGVDHPLQATTLHEIAEIHRMRQRYRKAIHICDAVLEIRKESLSERHIDVARAMATKASCLVVTGDYATAVTLLQDALSMAEKAVGPRHPAVADIYVHMAGMHLRKCHFDEAKDWTRKAISIYQNSNLDEDHPSLKEAMELMERVDRDEMLCV